jgi:hypothetical protein
VLLRLGVRRDGLPLRMGQRDGHTSDSTETPLAIEACWALGLHGVHGMVADRKAYGQRTLGVCLAQGVGLITLVPRTCAGRQEMEAWGQQQSALPLGLETPGRTRQEPPRRWHGQSVVRRVPVEDADGRLAMADRRFLVVHSSQLAPQAAAADAAAQAKEAERVAEPIQRVEARGLACAAAEAARHRVRRAWPRAAWAHATAVALPCPALSGRSGQLPQTAVMSRPSAAGRSPAGRGPLSPRRAPSGPSPLRGCAGVARPGHHGAARSLYGY